MGGMSKEARRDGILQFLADHDGWHGVKEIAAKLGMPRGTLSGDLFGLVECGTLVSRPPGAGGGFKMTSSDWAAVSDKKAPPAVVLACAEAAAVELSGKPAPDTPPELQGPVSFAGILEQSTSGDQEVDAIASCVEALKPLETVEIDAILDYVARRFARRARAPQ